MIQSVVFLTWIYFSLQIALEETVTTTEAEQVTDLLNVTACFHFKEGLMHVGLVNFYMCRP